MKRPILRNEGFLLWQIGEAEKLVSEEQRNARRFSLARIGVRAGIFLAALGSVYGTFRLPRDGFAQSLLSNLAAGLLVYLAAAPVLRGIRRSQAATLAAGVLVTALTLGWAYVSAPGLQSLLLNIGVGAALVLALDFNVARWLEAKAQAEGAARERQAAAAEMIKSAESMLDYALAVHEQMGMPLPGRFGNISLKNSEQLLSQFQSLAAGKTSTGSAPKP